MAAALHPTHMASNCHWHCQGQTLLDHAAGPKPVQSHVLQGLTPAVDLEGPFVAHCERCGEHVVTARQQLAWLGHV